MTKVAVRNRGRKAHRKYVVTYKKTWNLLM